MTMLVLGIVVWSAALVVLTWLAARPRAPEPVEIHNAEAEALQARVAEQERTLQEIEHDVARFDLDDYLNRPHED